LAKAADHEIKKKRNGRYYVAKRGGGVVNGEEKAKILVDKGLVKTGLRKPPEEAPTEEAPKVEAPAEATAE